MGIGAAITTFSTNTTISSSAMNSNFSSLNNAGLGNDSSAISTSGTGIITATGFSLGNSEHVLLGTGSTIQFTNGTTTNDTFYVETAPGHTDIQCFGTGQIRFKDHSGNTVAAVNPSNHSFALADSGQNLHDIVYVNTGSNETYFQMMGSGNFIVKDQNGTNLMHIDHSGNMVIKGSLTQNGTP
jgi:hypothetical protein